MAKYAQASLVLLLLGITGGSCFAQSQGTVIADTTNWSAYGSTAHFTLAGVGSAGSGGAASGPATNAVAAEPAPAQAASPGRSGASRVGIGFRASSLGLGAEVAVRVARPLNVRAGFNLMGLHHDFTNDGISYAGDLSFRSAEAHLDWFFFHSLHLSPGVLLYNGNRITANASVAGGQTFTLDGTQFESSSSDPVNGNGSLTFRKAAPTILFGIGNLVPRNGHRFSGSFEIGAAFTGAPNTTLALNGTACLPPASSGPTCQDVTTTPEIQSDVQAEQAKLKHDVSSFTVYPIIAGGFGFSF